MGCPQYPSDLPGFSAALELDVLSARGWPVEWSEVLGPLSTWRAL
jgi:hypothetical protein